MNYKKSSDEYNVFALSSLHPEMAQLLSDWDQHHRH